MFCLLTSLAHLSLLRHVAGHYEKSQKERNEGRTKRRKPIGRNNGRTITRFPHFGTLATARGTRQVKTTSLFGPKTTRARHIAGPKFVEVLGQYRATRRGGLLLLDTISHGRWKIGSRNLRERKQEDRFQVVGTTLIRREGMV